MLFVRLATDMNKPLLQDPAKYKALVSTIPLGCWGNSPEIAGPVVFLASDAASFISDPDAGRRLV